MMFLTKLPLLTAIIVGIFALCNGKSKKEEKSLSNGFGEEIDWVPWPKAVSTALDLDKPVFLLIHKTWCGACTALKKSFTTSSKQKELVDLSKNFVMANTEDDDEPEDEEYAPDGGYIPRLFFLDKYGKRLAVDNKKNYANNAHYFPQVPDVIKGMKLALELYEEQRKVSPDEPQHIDSNEQKKNSGQQKETPETDDSFGEIHLSDEELDIMETGGCPHAAAARSAVRAQEKEEKAKKAKEADKKKASKDSKESKETKEPKVKKETKESKETKEVKESNELRAKKENKELKQTKEANASKEPKAMKESKETKTKKETKAKDEQKETKKEKSTKTETKKDEKNKAKKEL